MRLFRIPTAVAAVLGLVVLTAWVMAWPLEKAIVLAPVIVVAVAAVAALVLLWAKVAWQQLRESRRPRLVIGLWLLGIGLLVLLTFLGVQLPRESG